MPSAKYAFVSAYLKGAESKILAPEHIDRMARVSNIQDVLAGVREVLEILKDTEAGSYLDVALVRTFDDADRYLWHYFDDCLKSLERLKLVPDEVRRVLKAYMLKYDVVNIKAALAGVTAGRRVNLIPMGVISSAGLLEELAGAEGSAEVVRVLREGGLGDYADVIGRYPAEEKNSRFLVEAGLDRVYYDKLLSTSRSITDGALLSKAFSIIIDMTNLALLNRAVIEDIGAEAGDFMINGGYLLPGPLAREVLTRKLEEIPEALGITQYREIAQEVVAGYGRTKSITAVDEIIDKHKFKMLREMLSPRVLTPLVVAWYLIVKEVEIRNLRLILKVTFDGIPVEEIKEYLVV